MEEKKIKCTLITPMFSLGAYKYEPELRTSELKGAMRYAYRIACPFDTGTLKKDEAELFGSAAGAGQSGGHASPVRLQICGEIEHKLGKLLHYKNEELGYIPTGDLMITALFNQIVFGESMLRHKVDLEWYIDLIKLSLILCGMGRRTRKGRGCFEIEDLVLKNKQQMLDWICSTLNKIASVSSKKSEGIYKIHYETITSTVVCHDKRPVVQKIWAGRKMDKGHICSYLKRVDIACHDLKLGKWGESLDIKITGNPGRKFASPLIIRIVKTKEGYYPLYILIKGVFGDKTIDQHHSQREKFIQELEKRTEGGKQ